jgi:DnaA family protein
MSEQLPLALRWPAHQRFDDFVAGSNADGLDLLRQVARGDGVDRVYLSAATGSGKTHLLFATCNEAGAHARTAQYLDVAKLGPPMADTIRRFGGSELLAIDNVDALAGVLEAEHALFDLYNRCAAEGTNLLFAAASPANALGIGLPDLVSRLSACTQWQIRPLDEKGRRAALRDRAARRGIELDSAVLDWMFARQVRDLGTLTRLLDRIDRAALAAQRRVTVPFLRRLLDETE